MTRKQLSPSKFPTKTKTRAEKRAEQREKRGFTDRKITPGQSPTQYRAKVAAQTQQITQATGLSATGQPTLSQSQADAIRGLTGGGLKVMQGMPITANMVAALRRDLTARNTRIENRDTRISNVENRAQNAAAQLNAYNQYIKDGVFVGSDQQYKQYQRDFNKYETLQNNYNRLVESHNIDVTTYNKNIQSLKSKTTPAEPIAKTIAAYDKASRYVSSKLPSPEKVRPAIELILKNAPGPNAYKILNATPQTRKFAQQIVDFNVGTYSAVKQKPLKAAATFATFFIGGAAIKGLGAAAKTLGAGAKTAKAARIIEGGLGAVYVAQSGGRYMLVEDARQAGFVTGDIIFNELLPAGLGLKYGIKVVSNLPKGVKLLKGTGTKVAKGTVEVAKKPIRLTKEIYTSQKKAWNTRQQVKADGKVLKETVTRLRAENKPVPQWMKDEMNVINQANRIKSPDAFKKFLADTKAEVSPQIRAKRKAAQQKLITETRTKTKEAVKTEEQLIAEFEAQQKQFLAAEAELKQAGFVQKTTPKQLTLQKQKTLQSQRNIVKQKQLLNRNLRQLQSINKELAAISILTISNTELQKLISKQKTQQQRVFKQIVVLKQALKQYKSLLRSYSTLQKQALKTKPIQKIITKQAAKPLLKIPKSITELSQTPPKIPKPPRIPTKDKVKKKPTKKRVVTKKYGRLQNVNQVATIESLFR